MTVQRAEPVLPESAWVKSSYSTGNGGECVEVAATADAVNVRDSKVRSGPVLSFPAQTWARFAATAAGTFG